MWRRGQKTAKSRVFLTRICVEVGGGPGIASSPLKKRGGGGVENFGSRDIGGWLALISGFWGDLRKKGE